MTTLIAVPDATAWVRDVFSASPEVQSVEIETGTDRVSLLMKDGTETVLEVGDAAALRIAELEEEVDNLRAEVAYEPEPDALDDADLDEARSDAVKKTLAMCDEARRARRPLPALEDVLEALEA
jgi:hypothetical protein